MTKAGRRSQRARQRAADKPSFLARYRTAIIVVAALVRVVLLSVFVFASAAQPAYACWRSLRERQTNTSCLGLGWITKGVRSGKVLLR